jgi:multisubunit Na+/H+ antiporter MnhC subunit
VCHNETVAVLVAYLLTMAMLATTPFLGAGLPRVRLALGVLGAAALTAAGLVAAFLVTGYGTWSRIGERTVSMHDYVTAVVLSAILAGIPIGVATCWGFLELVSRQRRATRVSQTRV